MLSISATDAGFHGVSGLGTPLAPNVFLNGLTNPSGTATAPDPFGPWALEDRGELAIALTPVDLEETGPFAGQIHFDAITFLRGDAVIGTLDLGAGIRVGATHDASNGYWFADVAEALTGLLQQGYRFEGGSGADVFDPAAQVLPQYGQVTLLGRGGDDVLVGARNDTRIIGGSGADTLRDIGGRDFLHGGAGDDVLELGLWSQGSLARGGKGNDRLTSSNGADVLRGNAGNDHLSGGRGNDRLTGGGDHDWLEGGEGDDRLTGGRGDDVLSGGWGADTFVFRAGQDGDDRITDFSALDGDRLRFAGLSREDITEVIHGEDLVLSWGTQASVTIEGGAYAPPLSDSFIF